MAAFDDKFNAFMNDLQESLRVSLRVRLNEGSAEKEKNAEKEKDVEHTIAAVGASFQVVRPALPVVFAAV